MQGSVSGLRVTNTSGAPGSSPTIVLRGGAGIESAGSPLVVVDGVVRSMDDVNPADIESIQVLKDAASTAIYGARANNGVILVQTKKGKEGVAQISYKFKGGLNFARKGYEYMDAENYIKYGRWDVSIRVVACHKLMVCAVMVLCMVRITQNNFLSDIWMAMKICCRKDGNK